MYSIFDKRHSRPFKATSCNSLLTTSVGSLKSFEYGLKWSRDKIRHFDVLTEVIAGRKKKNAKLINPNGVVQATKACLLDTDWSISCCTVVLSVVQTKIQSITYFYSLVNDTNPFNLLKFPKRFYLHICFSVEMASNESNDRNQSYKAFIMICVSKVASEKSPIYYNYIYIYIQIMNLAD